jgi:hypothetical protein
LWDTTKAVLRGMFIAMSAYIRKLRVDLSKAIRKIRKSSSQIQYNNKN